MSKHRYYERFPTAPTVLVSAIAAATGIPSIVDAKLCTGDRSVILDVAITDEFFLTCDHLAKLAGYFQVAPSDVSVEPSDYEDEGHEEGVSFLSICVLREKA